MASNQPNDEIKIAPDSVTLNNQNRGKYVGIYQNIPVNKLNNNVILSAEIKTDNISQGENVWNRGRIIFIQYDKNQKANYSTTHTLITLDGSNEWQKQSATFHIAPTTEFIKVIIDLGKTTGTLNSRAISLYNAADNPNFTLMKVTNLSLWAIFSIILFLPHYRNSSLSSVVFILVTTITIVIGVSISGTQKLTYRAKLISTFNAIYTDIIPLPETGQQSTATPDTTKISKELKQKHWPPDITKIAHFVLFMLLGFGLRQQSQKPFLCVITDLLFFASISEIIQLFQVNRTPLMTDVFIDMSGAMIGIAFQGLFTIARKIISNFFCYKR